MLEDVFRPLWLPTIEEVNGNPIGRLNEWVGSGQYYFDSPVSPGRAVFVLKPGATLVNLFAAEMSRFSSAAIETSLGVARSDMPKSVAWLMIQTYYAAFYAAHSILRSVGVSVTNFKTGECQKADEIAVLLGFSEGILDAAQFKCQYGVGRLECNKALGGGIHEQFWRVFDAFLQDLLGGIPRNALLSASDARIAISKLTNLQTLMRFGTHRFGNWLSTVRNEVTYMQQHKVWFPFGRTRAECDHLFSLQKEWRKNPDRLELPTPDEGIAERFVRTCAFLVSLSIEIVNDMALRCPNGKSFLYSGPLKLLSQCSA